MNQRRRLHDERNDVDASAAYYGRDDSLDALLDRSEETEDPDCTTREAMAGPTVVRRRGGGSRRRPYRRKRSTGTAPGRPWIDDEEPRDTKFSGRARQSAKDAIELACGNVAAGVDIFARALETGDVGPIVELSARLHEMTRS